MRENQELEERFTKRMFAIVDVEHEGAFDEAVVAIVPLPAGGSEAAEAARGAAIEKCQRAFGTEYLTLVPVAVDATAWNADSLVAVPDSEEAPFLFPSDALDEIGELLGLEESERDRARRFDPARVVEAVRASVDPRFRPCGRPVERRKQHARWCPARQYGPCDCDYDARSGLDRPAEAHYHAGFRPWPTAAFVPAQLVSGSGAIDRIEAYDRWHRLPWGCAR